MKVVKVYGPLKKRLGRGTFEFNVETPAQAIKALCVNFEGLEKWFIDNDQNGIAYKVLVGDRLITRENLEELDYPWSEKEVFSITPVLTGAGQGFGQFILGAALITVGIMTGGGAALFAKGGWAAATWTTKAAIGMGAALALGGVSQMLSPQPSMPKDAKRNENFGFGGVTNTITQGVPVPICYGRLYVGSAAISVGVDTDQVI